MLKNAIDWASRPVPNEAPLSAFKEKIAGLLSASPGSLGGLRALIPLRSILGNLGTIVVPNQAAIAHAAEAFTESGQLKDARQQAQIEAVIEQLLRIAARLKA